ncbi:hypothetical protein ACWD4V_00845 [Streptomyces tsukubensis]
MTTKNTTAKSTVSGSASSDIPTTSAAGRPGTPMETITLANHLNIEGRSYLPGATIRVPADYARRLRLSGYVART